ncbi:ABC transporter permease [Streptomyces paludis]|uniref:ABC transporter permease n=1 Tax=Streptomyces paludis TaxID=2282738 RepID=A0A345HLV8_9ACTN|nr:ABC transporter permease [Streptomyces paludis]AXG77682.1 ABC transporter permease [Streptomyces paludis]
MKSFLARRLLSGVVLVFVISTLTFVLMRMTGTDVARNIAGVTASSAQVAEKKTELGLDRPVFSQYLDWLGGALQGDLGRSWFSGDPVTATLTDKLPVTLSIVLGGLLLSAVVSVLLGVAAAVRGGVLDRVVQVVAVIGFALPSFLVALILAFFVGVKWGLLPATGYTTFAESPGAWAQSVILPSLSLAVGAIAATAQQVRGSMLDILAKDYIRTLRSRGLSNRSLLLKHALRNAAPAALTVLGLQFIGLVGGAVVVEKVFGLAGIGSTANVAAGQGDVPLLMGVVVVMVTLVVVVNLLLDVAQGWLNPKVRVG